MTAYYNEIDKYAAQWLRNLIDAGHIARGDVDERSIVDVRADDLRGYTQCHFFAGIGGWSYALRLAGWPDDRPVWTGSCPCQPFSAAGQGKAGDDERHLWPAWFSLIRECRPERIFGEQVEAAIGWGWLDLVCSDLEAEGYAVWPTVLPACSVGSPHRRDRLWFVAHSQGRDDRREHRPRGEQKQPAGRLPSGLVADANGQPIRGRSRGDGSAAAEIHRAEDERQWIRDDDGASGATGLVADAGVSGGRRQRGEQPGRRGIAADDSKGCELGDTGSTGLQEQRVLRSVPSGAGGTDAREAFERTNPWSDLVWLPCTDGKARPTQPGLFPLASGLRNRVGQLRAAGNSIVPQVAAEFIKACTE